VNGYNGTAGTLR